MEGWEVFLMHNKDLGMAWQGQAGRGMARIGAWPGWARRGMARLGEARNKARRGVAWRGLARQGSWSNKTTILLEDVMDRYKITLEGQTPLLMHRDNLAFSEKVKAWANAPENKQLSSAGDDRTPPWTWIGYLYHDDHFLGMDSDNIMTCLREGGAKVKTGNGKETYKKQTQSGIALDQFQFDLLVDGKKIPIEPIKALIGNGDFAEHIRVAEDLGFELLVKRAKVQRAKHIRVRPMFRNWALTGSLTVIDPELSGITRDILELIFNWSGAMCGLGDWRPSSPSSGAFGKFAPTIELIK